MALELDVSRPLRGLDGRRALVRAVVEAHQSDETDWLEWKTDLDLSTKAGCFHLAKAILGMANRPVEVAARTCGGHGYVIIGVEPSNLAGVEVPDPAQWIGLVEPYLKGEKAPPWDWTIVPIDGVDVLVVTVDPPQDGDEFWPLRKEFESYRSGVLFVRKPGKTEPALAEDVDALSRRLLAGASQLPQLSVEVVGDVPVPWLVGAEAKENVAVWVQGERDRHMAAAQAVEKERNKPAQTLASADRLDKLGIDSAILRESAKYRKLASEMGAAIRASGLAQFQDEPDERTLAEYQEELDTWARTLAEPAFNDLLRRYCEAGHGLVHLRVRNNSTQYLGDVEVRVHIDFEAATGFEDVPEGEYLPKAPWPFGKMKPGPLNSVSLFRDLSPIVPHIDQYSPELFRDTTIDNGSINATVAVGDLRPTAVFDGDDFFIFLPVRPADGLLHATWTATVKDRDGLIEGHLTIPVQEDPVDIGAVLSGTSNPTAGHELEPDDDVERS